MIEAMENRGSKSKSSIYAEFETNKISYEICKENEDTIRKEVAANKSGMSLDVSDELVQAKFSKPRPDDFNAEEGKKVQLYKIWSNLGCGSSFKQYGRTWKRGKVVGDFTDKVEEEKVLRMCCQKHRESKKVSEKRKKKREADDNGGEFHPLKKKITSGRWTSDEHERFLSGLNLHGKDMKKVAAHVKTRTVIQTRSHADKYFARVAKTNGGSNVQKAKRNTNPEGSVKKGMITSCAHMLYSHFIHI